MLSAKNGAMLSPIYESDIDYFVDFETHFLALPDGKTIIGVDGSNYKKLFYEDITSNGPESWNQIVSHGDNINTVYYELVSRSLFVGDNSGVVVQYKRNGTHSNWEQLCNYGNLGIGQIYSVVQIGNFLVFGGDGFELRVIDIANKEVIQGTLTTAIKFILSLQTCEVPDNQVQLSVSGLNPDYSNSLTDIFRIKAITKTTSLIPQLSIEEQEKLMKQVKSQEKYIISLEKKVSHLQSKLKKTEGKLKMKDLKLQTLKKEMIMINSQKNKMESHIKKIEKDLKSLKIKYKPLKDGQTQKTVIMQTLMLHNLGRVKNKKVEIL
jgi:hypothetical protein